MGLESASYISQLQPANPDPTDLVSQGDDHIRMIKKVLQNTFPNLSAAAVITTTAELNFLDGVTSSIQIQLAVLASEIDAVDDAKLNLSGGTMTGAILNGPGVTFPPTDDDEYVTKKYVDLFLPLEGGVLAGPGAQIGNPNLPLADDDLTNKKYVDDSIKAATPLMRRKLTLFDLKNKSTTWTADPGFDPVTEIVVGYEYILRNKVTQAGYIPGDMVNWPLNVNGGATNPAPTIYYDSVGHIAFAMDDYPKIWTKATFPSTAAPASLTTLLVGYWQVQLTLLVMKK
jgi:hypothetical protein